MVDVPVRPEHAPQWLNPLVGGLNSADAAAFARREVARKKLAHRTPGPSAPGFGAPAEAAVLMLLTGAKAAVERPAGAGVLITHRTPTLRSHSGQMAFPGGHIDPTDAGPVDAALREAWEETGLDRQRVTPLASLEPVIAGGSGRLVAPVLAFSADPGQPHVASPAETDDVFIAPLDELIAPENRLQVGMQGWSGPAFRVNGYLVWGFTGVLLDVICELAGWTVPWRHDKVIPLADALATSRNAERHR
ncbi:NUDIX hydrolase [Corynebacterium mayonis]|uniref:NUDIX hydrolase n=1 Tax=Corynebacterium mayonis TaxID=3062461 RepID=UPI0031406843